MPPIEPIQEPELFLPQEMASLSFPPSAGILYGFTTCDFSVPTAIKGHKATTKLADFPDWTPFQFASSTCYTNLNNPTTTPATASTTMGFTYGEILISFFLFILILGSVFGFIINNFLKRL